ncbi:MAG: YtxH domain-containing protein [Bacteroidetes bacterium]|nr:YtxH domain-containing protein [Bacteroidota bacterium]
MKNKGTILMGLASLFAAGVVVGTLYAPDKGDRTRRKLARKGRHMYHRAEDLVSEGKDNFDEIKDRLRDKLDKLNDEVERLSRC